MGTVRVGWGLACVAVALTTVSCARLGLDRWGLGGGDDEASATAPAAAPSVPVTTDEEREASLRQAVAEHMAATSGDESRLIRRRPYWYKEYSVYGGGPESARVAVSETDSRLTPYTATVEIDKQRFATRIHRERDQAEADRNFLRDTGTETLTYEWRGGHWEKAGSLFVAESTEEQVGGEWVAVQQTEKRTVAAEDEESQGILGRIWSLVGGG